VAVAAVTALMGTLVNAAATPVAATAAWLGGSGAARPSGVRGLAETIGPGASPGQTAAAAVPQRRRESCRATLTAAAATHLTAAAIRGGKQKELARSHHGAHDRHGRRLCCGCCRRSRGCRRFPRPRAGARRVRLSRQTDEIGAPFGKNQS